MAPKTRNSLYFPYVIREVLGGDGSQQTASSANGDFKRRYLCPNPP